MNSFGVLIKNPLSLLFVLWFIFAKSRYFIPSCLPTLFSRRSRQTWDSEKSRFPRRLWPVTQARECFQFGGWMREIYTQVMRWVYASHECTVYTWYDREWCLQPNINYCRSLKYNCSFLHTLHFMLEYKITYITHWDSASSPQFPVLYLLLSPNSTQKRFYCQFSTFVIRGWNLYKVFECDWYYFSIWLTQTNSAQHPQNSTWCLCSPIASHYPHSVTAWISLSCTGFIEVLQVCTFTLCLSAKIFMALSRTCVSVCDKLLLPGSVVIACTGRPIWRKCQPMPAFACHKDHICESM